MTARGTWTCAACAERLGLDTGSGATHAGRAAWCGAGGHRVLGAGEVLVRWAPDQPAAGASAPPATAPSHALPLPAQGTLF